MNVTQREHIPVARIGARVGMVCVTLPALSKVTWNLGLALGPRGFLVTNMWVLVTQNARVRGLDHCKALTQMGSRSGGI